ncbi:Cytochrome P450 94C1 [Elsinoe australis]|uniref:Cytochrome P450 94C1 n=1 Tax=Elsinoe australis TaxID=40998 RepID=A0A2P7ZE65_9PEZI|nr:Cytochrome P450 94C1 [Elsinoe australis]
MSTLPFGTTTYVVCGIIGALCYLIYRATIPTPFAGIPYDKSYVKPFGHAGDQIAWVKKNETVFDWMALQGRRLQSPIYQLFLMPFSKPTLVITDPRECQDILLRRAKEFDRSTWFTDLFLGTIPDHHIVQQTNDRFRAQRRLLADTMTTGFLHNVAAQHLHEQTVNLISLWRTKSRLASNHAFPIQDDINEMALDSIWAVAFGTEIDTVKTQDTFLQSKPTIPVPNSPSCPIDFPKPPLPAAFHSIMYLSDSILYAIRSPHPRLGHWWFRQSSAFKAAKSHKDKLIAERLADAKSRLLNSTATDAMIRCATDNMVRREQQAAEKEGRAPTYDSPAAKDELFGFLIGGHDTTSSTVMWGVKFLTDYAEVQAKLRAALRAAYPAEAKSGAVPSAEAICRTNVPYLDATIEEMLRMGMTAPGASRKAMVDTEVLGYRVPKGTDVFLLSNGSGFVEEDVYAKGIEEGKRSRSSREAKGRVGTWDAEDVGRFVPERWIKRDEKGNEEFYSRAGPMMTFGGGIRGCFGKRLAYLEMRILFTIMVWELELQKAPESLSGYGATDNLTHKPKQCYLRPVALGAQGRKDSATEAEA